MSGGGAGGPSFALMVEARNVNGVAVRSVDLPGESRSRHTDQQDAEDAAEFQKPSEPVAGTPNDQQYGRQGQRIDQELHRLAGDP